VAYASYPNPAFGYFRGVGSEGPLAGGQGSMAGPKLQGLGFLSQGQGSPGSSGWDPTIVYLLILIVVEMVVFGFISRMLR
jgi:hypothetical protein